LKNSAKNIVPLKKPPSKLSVVQGLWAQVDIQKRFWLDIAKPCLEGKQEMTDALIATGDFIFNVKR